VSEKEIFFTNDYRIRRLTDCLAKVQLLETMTFTDFALATNDRRVSE